MERNAQHAFDAEEVMAYLDGELEPQRAAALAAHLVSCSECQEVAQGFRALSERMLSFEVEPPSAGMNETVLAALDSSQFVKENNSKPVPSKIKLGGTGVVCLRGLTFGVAGLGLRALLAVVAIPRFAIPHAACGVS